MSGLGGKPLAKFGSGMVGHVHGGVLGRVLKTPIHKHVVVLNGGLGDGIDKGRFFEVGLLDGVAVVVAVAAPVFIAGLVELGIVLPKRVVEAPGDFGGGDPEWGEFDGPLFSFGIAELKFASGNGDKLEGTVVGLGDFLFVVFESVLLGLFSNEGVQAFGERELFGRGELLGWAGKDGRFLPHRREEENKAEEPQGRRFHVAVLGDLEFAWDGKAGGLEIVVKGEVVGSEIEIGFPELIPSESSTGLAGVGAEEGVGGGVDHVVASVDLLACAQGGKELVMLDLIHVLFLAGLGLGAPNHLPLMVLGKAAARPDHGSVGAGDAVNDLIVNALDLTLGNVAKDVARIFVGDSMVIVDVAGISAPNFTASSNCGDRFDVVHGPSDLVGGVNGLLEKSASGEPVEVDPVSHLPLDHTHSLGLLSIVGEGANRAGEIGSVNRFDATVFPRGDLGVGFDDGRVESPTESILNGESLRLGFHHRGQNRTQARGVDRHRLFDKHVDAGFDSGGNVAGAKAGSRSQDDQVDSGGDDLLVAVDAGELSFGGDLGPFA